MKSEFGIWQIIKEHKLGIFIGSSIIGASLLSAYGAVTLAELPELWNEYEYSARQVNPNIKPPIYNPNSNR